MFLSPERRIEPTTENDRDEPVVLGALRDEKNPAVRDYVAGLVRQVEKICESRGAKAADLGKSETQEKLSTDELSTVRKLVGTILGMRRGELDSESRSEILRGMDAREAAAQQVLESAVAKLNPFHFRREWIEALLREGMIDDAERMTRRLLPDSKFGEARILMARAIGTEASNPSAACKLATSAARSCDLEAMIAGGPIPDTSFSNDERIRLFSQAYAMRLRLLEESDLRSETSLLHVAGISWCLPLERELLRRELARRALVPDENDSVVEHLAGRVYTEELNEKSRMEVNAQFARIAAENGESPRTMLLESLWSAHDWGTSKTQSADWIRDILFIAGEVGALKLVEDVAEASWMTDIIPPIDTWSHVAAGCIAAGRLDEASSILRSRLAAEPIYASMTAERIAKKMLASGDRIGAERFAEEMQAAGHPFELRALNEYLCVRARGGEDVLKEMEEDHGPNRFSRIAGDRALVAISTIGYVRSMRKTIAEYVPKP